jgi:ribosomal protein S18 acetylase RimI-like enzyme
METQLHGPKRGVTNPGKYMPWVTKNVRVCHCSFGSSLARQALDGEMELRLLAVLPQARRSGIGWRLLAESANLSQATGASGLVLDTGADNERSQQLYRRFGFVQRSERERPRPAPKVQLVVYTLDLAGHQAA